MPPLGPHPGPHPGPLPGPPPGPLPGPLPGPAERRGRRGRLASGRSGSRDGRRSAFPLVAGLRRTGRSFQRRTSASIAGSNADERSLRPRTAALRRASSAGVFLAQRADERSVDDDCMVDDDSSRRMVHDASKHRVPAHVVHGIDGGGGSWQLWCPRERSKLSDVKFRMHGRVGPAQLFVGATGQRM